MRYIIIIAAGLLFGITGQMTDGRIDIETEGQGTWVLDLRGYSLETSINTEYAFQSGHTLVIYDDYTVGLRPNHISETYVIPYTRYYAGAEGIAKKRGVLRIEGKIDMSPNDEKGVIISPNPFNVSAEIRFNTPSGNAEVSIVDVMGKSIRTLHTGHMEEGTHSLIWNGRSDNGEESTSGIYFVRIASEKGIAVERLLLAK